MKNGIKTTKLYAGGIFAVLFVILILLVKFVDVAPIGPEGTSIGLSTINKAFNDMTGTGMFWYYITQGTGILAILVVVALAAIGVLQLVKRKDIRKVDQCILVAGGLYAVVMVLYVFFEKVIINYRPVIMIGETAPEASFPSSHTMLICVVMGSAFTLIPQYIDDRHSGKIIRGICVALITITVFGRLVCGVHWFTDILGGALLSCALLMFFQAFVKPRKGRPARI